ncbi:NDR1/HIN1-like protein 13 [Linum perenne]
MKKKSTSCCRICCCTILVIVILTLLLAAITGFLFYLYQPKLPSFNIKSFKVPTLNLTPKPNQGTYFSAAVSASVQITNPNDKININYGETHVEITLGADMDTDMGSTTLPPFEQTSKQITSLKVDTSVKDQLLDKDEEERLPRQFRDKSLVVNLEVKSSVGFEVFGLNIGMFAVQVTCNGMTLREIDSGRSPECTIYALHRLDHRAYVITCMHVNTSSRTTSGCAKTWIVPALQKNLSLATAKLQRRENAVANS